VQFVTRIALMNVQKLERGNVTIAASSVSCTI
jgi:hypothetical protein